MLSFLYQFGEFRTPVSLVRGSAVLGELKIAVTPGGSSIAIKVCAALSGRVFVPFWSENGSF